MCAHESAICLLLAKGANPHAQDHRGWTPVHHRLLLGEGGLQSKLIEVSNLKLQNDLHATALKILALITLQKSLDIHCLWRPSPESPSQPMSPEYYEKITKSISIREHHVSSRYLHQRWLEPFTPTPGLYPFTPAIAKDYIQQCANPTLHILSPATHDECGHQLPISLGLGVYSNGIFPAQRVVGEYMGKMCAKIPSSAYWLFNGGDAQRKSSPVTRINCGFPNVAMMRIPAQEGVEGLDYRLAFVSLEEIDGQFCWNYGGHHHVKTGPYVELRPQAMRDFVRSNDLVYLLTCLLNDMGDRCKDWETYVKAEKTRYIVQTPSALFLLILEGLIPAPIAYVMLAIAETGKLVQGLEKFSHLSDVAIALHKLYQTIQESDQAFGRDFLQTFHHLSATLPFTAFLKTSEDALKRMKSGTPSKDEWDPIKADLLRPKPTMVPKLTLPSIPPSITDDELWAAEILLEKFPNPGEKNHAVNGTFHSPKRREKTFSGSQTAWEMLGLNSNENDIRKITVQYRKLCLKYHPDKNPQANPQKLIDIILAYKEIVLKLTPAPFKLDVTLSVERNFQNAIEYFGIIRESNLDITSKRDQLSAHSKEVQKLLEFAEDEKDELFLIHVDFHLKTVKNLHSIFQLMLVLDAFDRLPANATYDQKTAFYIMHQERLTGLVEVHDLNNEKFTWSEVFLKDFLLINHRITDMLIASHRSLAEIHAAKANKGTLSRLRKILRSNYANRKKNVQIASKRCRAVSCQYTDELRRFSKPTQRVPEPFSSESSCSQIVLFQAQTQEEKSDPAPHPTPLKKQRDVFEINTKKNMQFFTLKSKKGDE